MHCYKCHRLVVVPEPKPVPVDCFSAVTVHCNCGAKYVITTQRVESVAMPKPPAKDELDVEHDKLWKGQD